MRALSKVVKSEFFYISILLMIGTFFLNLEVKAQEKPEIEQIIDSLSKQIEKLEATMPKLAKTKGAKFFFNRRELDLTRFKKDYYVFLTEENFDAAGNLIDKRRVAYEKRADNYALKIFNEYHKDLSRQIGKERARYQELFRKERTFKKAFYEYAKEEDEASLKKADQMMEKAIKYAQENNLESVLEFLEYHKTFLDAKIYDYYSDYDIKVFTRNKSEFKSVFLPLVKSDSIEDIHKAGELAEYCYDYAATTKSLVDTGFFAEQKKIVEEAIGEYYERVGYNKYLADIGEESINARRDTLNKEGIYSWKGHIVIIGYFIPNGDYIRVKKGEAILDADKKLIKHIKNKKIAKVPDDMKIGYTFFIPYKINQKEQEFMYDKKHKKYQYMICYTTIASKYFTEQVSNFLPIISFEENEQLPISANKNTEN